MVKGILENDKDDERKRRRRALQSLEQKFDERRGFEMGRISPGKKLIGREVQSVCDFIDGPDAGVDTGVPDIVRNILADAGFRSQSQARETSSGAQVENIAGNNLRKSIHSFPPGMVLNKNFDLYTTNVYNR